MMAPGAIGHGHDGRQHVAGGRRPLPEALTADRGGAWHVVTDGQAHTSVDRHEMHVPADAGPCSVCGHDHVRGVRLHEMQHAQRSPSVAEATRLHSDGYGAADGLAAIAEEARLLLMHEAIGLTVPPSICPRPDEVGRMLPPSNVDMTDAMTAYAARRTVAEVVMAAYDDADLWPVVQRVVRDRWAAGHELRRVYELTYKAVRKAGSQWRKAAKACAGWEHAAYGTAAAGRVLLPPVITTGIAAIGWRWSVALGTVVQRIIGRPPAVAQPNGEPQPGDDELTDGGGSQEPPHVGTDRVRWLFDGQPPNRPDLPRRTTAAVSPSVWRRSDDGPPLFPTGLPDGGAVFGRRRRMPAGVAILDASGSMNWDDRTLAMAADAIPAGVVLAYNASGVHVVAEDGRIVDADTMARIRRGNGANACDGPALAIGAAIAAERNAYPVVWISDGQANGAAGSYVDAEAEARRLAVEAGAVRVRTVEGAVRAFHDLRGRRATADDVPDVRSGTDDYGERRGTWNPRFDRIDDVQGVSQ